MNIYNILVIFCSVYKLDKQVPNFAYCVAHLIGLLYFCLGLFFINSIHFLYNILYNISEYPLGNDLLN